MSRLRVWLDDDSDELFLDLKATVDMYMSQIGRVCTLRFQVCGDRLDRQARRLLSEQACTIGIRYAGHGFSHNRKSLPLIWNIVRRHKST